MATYTYTVICMDAEIACAEAERFEDARIEALSNVDAMYPREDLEFIANCSTGAVGQVSGPCYL
jgi:hypothetical protein